MRGVLNGLVADTSRTAVTALNATVNAGKDPIVLERATASAPWSISGDKPDLVKTGPGQYSLVIHGRSLAAAIDERGESGAIDGLDAALRWGALGSQMHMTANRLGLHTTEESYLSGILCRCLDALGDDLVDLVWQAQGDAPAEGLDAQVSAGMQALFAEGFSHLKRFIRLL